MSRAFGAGVDEFLFRLLHDATVGTQDFFPGPWELLEMENTIPILPNSNDTH